MPLISRPEAKLIKKALGKFQYPLAMTVAKLYISKREGIWYDTGAWGVIVLTIDRENEKLPHLLKLLDMGSFKIIFQQEVYEMMQYRVPEPDFHSFEIPEMVVGFRFASMEEAKEFGSKVRGRLQVLIEKTAQRNNEAESKAEDGRSRSFVGMFRSFGRTIFGGRRASRKEYQIGRPKDFKHNCHVGYDPEKGFDLDNISAEWKKIFKNAGIKKKHLRDKEKAAQIFELISQPGVNAPPLEDSEGKTEGKTEQKETSNNKQRAQSSGIPKNDKILSRNKSALSAPGLPPKLPPRTKPSRRPAIPETSPPPVPPPPGVAPSVIPSVPSLHGDPPVIPGVAPVPVGSTPGVAPPGVPELPPGLAPPPMAEGLLPPPDLGGSPIGPPTGSPALQNKKKGPPKKPPAKKGMKPMKSQPLSLAEQIGKIKLKKGTSLPNASIPAQSSGAFGGLKEKLQEMRKNFQDDDSDDDDDDEWSD
ncbi:hypothetical protein AAMO2058_001752600 [Amorphochlora amoebiformis]